MWKLAAKLIVSGLLIGVIIHSSNIDSVLVHIRSVPSGIIIFCLILSLLLAAAQTLRWMLVIRASGASLAFNKALPTVMVGWFFNQALPSTIGGDAFRIWYARRYGLPLETAIHSVVIDRFTGLLGILMLVLSTLPWMYDQLASHGAANGILAAAVLATLSIILLFVADRAIAAHLPERYGKRLEDFCYAARLVLLKPRFATPVVVLSLSIQWVLSFIVWLLAQGMSIDVRLVDCMLLVPIALMVMAIPISIAGWGLREGAMVMGFGFAGVPPANALALSLLFGLVGVLSALPGGICWWFMHHEKPDVNKITA